MKLSDYAKSKQISYKTAWRWFKQGIITGTQYTTGTIIVDDILEKVKEKEKSIAIYARVSSSENKDNLERQAERLLQFAAAKGYQITKIIKEIGSGLNDSRPKFNALLEDSDIDIILVEHKDRATRFGFNHIQSVLKSQNREIYVINLSDSKKEDLIEDFIAVITSFCSRIYGKRRSKRKTEQLIKELENDKDSTR